MQTVRTYVIHLLGTYVTILCNWLILWQNALYLYLGRSRMCLILQETLFQVQVLKSCKSIQDSSLKSVCHWSSTASIYRDLWSCLACGSTAALQIGICQGLWSSIFQDCFSFNPWLYVWEFFSHNSKHIKWLF